MEVGPWEFLNLVRHSRLVISGSFHALVFATLFHVPFWAVNGDKDNRMVTFLKNMNLQDRTINEADKDDKIARSFSCDYSAADAYLREMRAVCMKRLKEYVEA